MGSRVASFPRLLWSAWPVFLIAAVQIGLHLWVNAHDQFFRDELYYLAAGQHLDLGYVDFPPFVAAAAAGARALFGASLVGIRLLPALAGALIILIAAGIAAELGAGPLAQALTALAVALGPVFLGSSGILTMDIFDQLWWSAGIWILIRLVQRQNPRLWLAFGLIAGVAMLTKVTFGFFTLAVIAGLLLTPQRRLLFNRWLLLGGGIALLIFSPYLIWQFQHGFPTLEFWRTYASGKTYPVTPPEFLAQQILTAGWISLPLWLAGLFFFFFNPAGKPYRFLGWAYLFLYAIFTITQAKFYFLSPMYPALFAGGATVLDQIVRWRPGWRWFQAGYLGVVALISMTAIPLAVPILSPEAYIRYSAAFSGLGNVKIERNEEGELPQLFADHYGWQEIVASVANVYSSLSPAERDQACLYTDNYGEAGAIDLYGPAYGLPKAISGHNSYYLWGIGSCTGKVMISIGKPYADEAPWFDSVTEAGQTHCRYCMPFENDAPILILRGLKGSLADAWPTAKDYH
ncbi:MAG TPA: glycosyltransferase family 39 protein [Anaerolineaceae bacterium]|nr:glycosyltransferase family 39 protein [Anaerolineaceae bacterium]